MIYQIAPVETETTAVPSINRGLIRARHIQAQVKERHVETPRPTEGILWSPITAGPFVVPVTRWIE